MVVHIADAPCHGREFNDCSDDTRPDDGKLIKPLLQQLSADLEVDYFFGAMNSRTAKMVAEMNRQMEREYVKPVEVKGASAGASAVGASIRSAVTKSISASLCARRTAASRSMAAEVSARGWLAEPKAYLAYAPLKPELAAFKSLPLQEMSVYINTGIENVDELRKEGDTLLTFSKAVPKAGGSDTQRCQVQTVPFSKGASRLAFHALVRPQMCCCCEL